MLQNCQEEGMLKKIEHLSDGKGWLEDDDPFFKTIEKIIENRPSHIPRIWEKAVGRGHVSANSDHNSEGRESE